MVSTEHRIGRRLRCADLASNQAGTFEFKRTVEMPSGRLQQLHGSIIEVDLEVQGSQRSVRGRGIYDTGDPDFGPTLRILVSDPSGDFELLISESNWTGCFESSELPNCDYRISLASSVVKS